ncbi:DNA recombination protein RmuC [Patescibacteria group bacterium]|nr:MAG: DNA recombination protein RmuC [Patescibacteria group bacterium]
MNSIEIAMVVVIVGLIAFLFYSRRSVGAAPLDSSVIQLLNDIRRDMDEVSTKGRTELQGRLDRIDDRMSRGLNDSMQMIQKHSAHTSGIVRDVTEKLTKLDETNKQVLDFSKQLQSLENILKNPKQRGILGEYWLETLLGQVLQPTQYQMQYDLGVDEDTNAKLIPDAVIFVKEMLIPIDAKFSLENYNKISLETDALRREALEREFKSDVKKRIDETSKYIRPERGTTNFSFMFVPAEGVYHNLITSSVGAVNVNTRNLIEYAFEKGVMIVSPTSFFAYLQTVLLGLRALQIEDSVKEIQVQAEHLNRHLKAYEEYHGKVGKHLETTARAYAESSNELKKIDKDIFKIAAGKTGKALASPEIDRETEIS